MATPTPNQASEMTSTSPKDIQVPATQDKTDHDHNQLVSGIELLPPEEFGKSIEHLGKYQADLKRETEAQLEMHREYIRKSEARLAELEAELALLYAEAETLDAEIEAAERRSQGSHWRYIWHWWIFR